jgi:hypothetical protein
MWNSAYASINRGPADANLKRVLAACPLRARSGQSGVALGENSAHFVATIRRSLWSAVEGGMAEEPSCLLLSTKTATTLE